MIMRMSVLRVAAFGLAAAEASRYATRLRAARSTRVTVRRQFQPAQQLVRRRHPVAAQPRRQLPAQPAQRPRRTRTGRTGTSASSRARRAATRPSALGLLLVPLLALGRLGRG